MSLVKKIEPNDKVMKKIHACRENGLEIKQDFLDGVAEVFYEGEVILRCVRVSDSSWQMEYNDRFWDEVERGPEEEKKD